MEYGTPAVYLDCERNYLGFYSWDNDVIKFQDLINEENKPNRIVQQIPCGRAEDRDSCVLLTLGLTIFGSILAVIVMILKSNVSTISVYD